MSGRRAGTGAVTPASATAAPVVATNASSARGDWLASGNGSIFFFLWHKLVRARIGLKSKQVSEREGKVALSGGRWLSRLA